MHAARGIAEQGNAALKYVFRLAAYQRDGMALGQTRKFNQIFAVLKQNEQGVPVPYLCRENGMSQALFYRWRSKFGGMEASMMQRLKGLEQENAWLKKMYAEEKLKAEIRQEALEGEL